MFDFNEWRMNYDNYSFEDQKKIYNKLAVLYPNQQHYDVTALLTFLSYPHSTKLKILEVGGWKGELANKILKERISNKIDYWHNYEISKNTIIESVCKYLNYKVILTNDFVWNLDIFQDYNICVLSHIIEHIKMNELKKFFKKIKHIKHIYIHAPIRDEPISWNNYHGTHILEVGWKKIKEILNDYNEQKYTDQIRFFRFKFNQL